MGQLVEFDLNDGGTILVEVHEMTHTSGPITRGLDGGQVTERARHTFEDAVERVEPAGAAASCGGAVSAPSRPGPRDRRVAA
jgi:hypothetical protein